MKHQCDSTVDRISSLPSNVMECILSYLPIQDAVKTSVLSKQWMREWRNVPELVFDSDFCELSSNTEANGNNLFFNVFRVLSLHRGPLLKFSFTTPSFESHSAMHALIVFLCELKQVQHLKLHFRFDDYELPSRLFSHAELRGLDLDHCLFNLPPTFRGFSSLVHLQLRSVELDPDNFSSFISQCPSLEKLIIEYIGLGYPLCRTVIDAPKLKLFQFDGDFDFFTFKNTPLLATVVITSSFDEQDIGCRSNNFVEFFECVPAIEYLHAGGYFFEFPALNNSWKRLPRNVEHLRVVELTISFHEKGEVECLLCFLFSCPKLQKLGINVVHDYGDPETPVEELIEARDIPDCSFNELQEVQMYNFNGAMSVVEFVKYLLTKSIVLEKLFIDFDFGRHRKKEARRIFKQISRFRRASPKAEIIYS